MNAPPPPAPDPATMSLAQKVALLPPDQREKILDGIPPDTLAHDWSFWGRPSQLLPDDDSWATALLIAGRGFGKTLAATQWARRMARSQPRSRGFLVARTAADIRDTLVNGASGIIAVHPPSERPEWEPSKRLLTWPNGTTALAISADNPDLLRGPQSHWSICDEIATWDQIPDASGLTAWDNTLIATRLGANPRVVAMTTPKNTQFMRDLVDRARTDPRWLLRTGSTYENAGNLSQTYIDQITGMYEGTALARQELHGEMFDGDLEGTLWTPRDIEPHRVDAPPDSPLAVVVGVDPSVAERPRDECGIVVAAATTERNSFARHYYVLHDASLRAAPAVWARTAAETARRFSAPIVVEVNQGGALVRDAIASTDPSVRILEVRATESKRTRAEPVALLYQQCVAPDTEVLTGRGPIRADSLSPHDTAITRRGPRRILWHGSTGTEPVLRLSTAHTSVTCTAEHPVFVVGRGFVPARGVRHGDRLLVWQKKTHGDLEHARTVERQHLARVPAAGRVQPSSGGGHVRPDENLWSSGGFATTCRAMDIGGHPATMAGCSSIGLSGSTTTDLWIPGSISTTSITIPGTTTFPTSRSNSPATTLSTIIPPDWGGGPQIRTDLGSAVPLHEHDAAPSWSGSATSAKNLTGPGPLGVASAPLNATPGGGIEPSVQEVLSIKDAGTSPVWNLMVETDNEFFANGILTHNCRVHHVGTLPQLEEQMTLWQPETTKRSPDRVDACIARGTPVTTPLGPVPVESVRPGDRVMTRGGWRTVVAQRLTRRAAATVTLTTATRSLTCTPDHLVHTDTRGWAPAGSLTTSDTLTVWTSASRGRGSSSSGAGSGGPGTRTMRTGANGSTTRTSHRPGRTSTVPSTKTPMDQSRPSTSSTTGTGTLWTTGPRTSRRSRTRSITRSIWNLGNWITSSARSASTTWSGSAPLLPSGTPATRAANGTASTGSAPGRGGSLLPPPAHARGAAGPSTRSAPSAPSSATATAGTGTTAGSDTGQISSANTAAVSSRRTSTRSAGFAPEAVLRVTAGPTVDVYDLQVDSDHEFVAGGVLVHNCVWALSALSSGTRRGSILPPRVRTRPSRASRLPLPPITPANGTALLRGRPPYAPPPR